MTTGLERTHLQGSGLRGTGVRATLPQAQVLRFPAPAETVPRRRSGRRTGRWIRAWSTLITWHAGQRRADSHHRATVAPTAAPVRTGRPARARDVHDSAVARGIALPF